MTEPELMPIGRLARVSRLSVKALRLYDAEGLLAPAWVDPDSGYRYYRREQIRTATAIGLLRSLDMPLAVIRTVLDAHDAAAVRSVLAGERDRVEREIAERESSLRALERLLAAEDVLPYAVALVEQPALRIGGLSGMVSTERIVAEAGALARSAAALAERNGWSLAGGLVGHYPLDLTDPCPISIGVPVGPAVEPVAEVPAGLAASTVHVGAYEELRLAYATLLGWAHEHGHEPRGPFLETYLNAPDDAPPHELVTRVAMLVGEPET